MCINSRGELGKTRIIHYSMNTRLKERLVKFGITFRGCKTENAAGSPEPEARRRTVVDALKTHFERWYPQVEIIHEGRIKNGPENEAREENAS